MIEIGRTYTLEVVKSVNFGFYLDAGALGDVLLPRRYAPKDLRCGDDIDVFLYLDSEDRPVATTLRPKAEIDQFAYLQVVDNTPIGAFLGWGLDKDLLVPFSEQHRPMETGRHYLVYLYLNKVDGRITASSRVNNFLHDDRAHALQAGQGVDLIVANTTDLGYKVIINHSYWGVLHKQDALAVQDTVPRLSFGQSINGYIKHVRPDRRIDVSLRSPSELRDKHSQHILAYLERNNGFSSIHDKSSPEAIQKTFNLSKSSFKKAIGGLYKKQLIELKKDGIALVKK